jgi:glycosyltransferase 2 family protein
VDTRELGAAFGALPAQTWLGALALTAFSLGCGLLRFWLLLAAFGAERRPALGTLAKHYLIGFFYNTYLPGAVSGDVVRGIALQRAFGPGSAGSFAVVLMERALGLCALLALTASASWLHPLPGLTPLALPAGVALLAALAGTLALAFGRELSAHWPARLRKLGERLPAARALLPLSAAGITSLATQLCPALCGFLLVQALAPQAQLADALVIVPLAAAAAFLPITISGAGVREAVFVELFALVSVPGQAALAASLGMWLCQAVLAALGGAILLLDDPFAEPAPVSDR